MDNYVHFQDHETTHGNYASVGTSIAYGIAALYIVHQVLLYYDYPVLSPQELCWNAIVYLIPARLLLSAAQRQELKEQEMLSQTHAAKSEALRRMLGMGGTSLAQNLVGSEGIARRLSTGMGGVFTPNAPASDAPPGLGNWDNSCYQNSVLQGLAALDSMRNYLRRSSTAVDGTTSTSGSLQETIAKLNDPGNNGRQLWTPAKLKSMSSWQQQDAQEYFSKIMDELDKEAAKAVRAKQSEPGLESAVLGESQKADSGDAEKCSLEENHSMKNPMEGLLAQRVACTRCGFSEGLSMIPFNCLTIPLGSSFSQELDGCLNRYTSLEEISDVDCAKCTLLRAEGQLKQMLPPPAQEARESGTSRKPSVPESTFSLPPELRTLAADRLQAIRCALDEDDFSDKTLNDICQIPKRAHVSSTKTRQAVIGRAPRSLVIHVNRSVFDEVTMVQSKNYASVHYPLVLDLGEWMLGNGGEGSATQSMLQASAEAKDRCMYRLKAVVTHYGRHENGHYICYRQHPILRHSDGPRHDTTDSERPERWWRLSDEDVSAVTEEDVLAQGGVFMLFYEREVAADVREPMTNTDASVVQSSTTSIELNDGLSDAEQAAAIPLPPDNEDPNVTNAPLAESTLPDGLPGLETRVDLAPEEVAQSTLR